MMIAGTILMERAERKTRRQARPESAQGPEDRSNLVRNPLVIGLAGALVISRHAAGGPVKIVVDQLAGVAAPWR
jgi:malonate transporter